MEEVDGLTRDINILGENKMNARLNEFLLDNNIIYFEEYDSVTKNIDSFGNIEKIPYYYQLRKRKNLGHGDKVI